MLFLEPTASAVAQAATFLAFPPFHEASFSPRVAVVDVNYSSSDALGYRAPEALAVLLCAAQQPLYPVRFLAESLYQ